MDSLWTHHKQSCNKIEITYEEAIATGFSEKGIKYKPRVAKNDAFFQLNIKKWSVKILWQLYNLSITKNH